MCSEREKENVGEERKYGKAHSWKEKRKETPKIKAVKKKSGCYRLWPALEAVSASDCSGPR